MRISSTSPCRFCHFASLCSTCRYWQLLNEDPATAHVAAHVTKCGVVPEAYCQKCITPQPSTSAPHPTLSPQPGTSSACVCICCRTPPSSPSSNRALPPPRHKLASPLSSAVSSLGVLSCHWVTSRCCCQLLDQRLAVPVQVFHHRSVAACAAHRRATCAYYIPCLTLCYPRSVPVPCSENPLLQHCRHLRAHAAGCQTNSDRRDAVFR